MIIYYDKATETISGTDMLPVKTEYYFDNTHCIHAEGGQSWPHLRSVSQSRSLMIGGNTGEYTMRDFSISLGQTIPYESGNLREKYGLNDFIKVFGHRTSLTYFDERVNPEPLLVKKITYEYKTGEYKPLETVENYYSSHDRFSFYAGLFVQSNVYKTFHEEYYDYNLIKNKNNDGGTYATLHIPTRILSERLRLDSTAVTRHYPDGSQRKIWQRHYYDRLLSSLPSNPLYKPDSLSFTSSSLLPVSTVTSFGTEYTVHSVIRAADIKKSLYKDMCKVGLGRTPVTEKWHVGSPSGVDSLAINREFAYYNNFRFRMMSQTLTSDSKSVIARQKFTGYNSRGRITSMIDADGTNLQFTWDETDNLLLSKTIKVDGLSNGLTTTFTHQPLVGCTSITLPNGTKRSYSYSAGRLVEEKNTSGETLTSYSYALYDDSGKNMTETTVYADSRGATTRVFYDGFGLPIESVAVNGSGDGKQHVATYTVYDGLDRPVKEYRPIAIDAADEIIEPHDFASLASSFYNGDALPYSQNIYLASPGERIAATYSPGEAFEGQPANVYYWCNSTTNPQLTVKRYIYNKGLIR